MTEDSHLTTRESQLNKHEGCGDPQHVQECVCDVVVSQPLPITDDLRYGWLVPRIMELADVAAPLSGQTLLGFLETWVTVHDAVYDPPRRRPATATSFQSQDEPWRAHARQRFRDGASSTEVRAEVLEKFGVALSKSNASHLRRRTLQLEVVA
jgi:hypothetical protein